MTVSTEPFPTWRTIVLGGHQVELVLIHGSDVGLGDSYLTTQLPVAVLFYGLAGKSPEEMVPALREQHPNWPEHEWLHCVTDAIPGSRDPGLRVVGVYHDLGSWSLPANYGRPDYKWDKEQRWVFPRCLPRST